MRRKLKPVHPGEILLEEFMKPLGLSINKLALDVRVPINRIADIVHQRRGITPDTALRLARYVKNAPVFWMNLQVRYNLEVAEDSVNTKANQVLKILMPAERPAFCSALSRMASGAPCRTATSRYAASYAERSYSCASGKTLPTVSATVCEC